MGFPGGPVITNPPCNAGDAGSTPGRGTKIPHDCEQLIPRTTTKDPAWHKEGPTLLQLRLDAANQRPFKKYETHHSIYSWEKIVEFWTNLVCDLEQVTSPKPLAAAAASSLQSRLALCSPLDCSPPGFSVHGIFQARMLEWVILQGYYYYPSLDLIPTPCVILSTWLNCEPCNVTTSQG